MVLPFLEHHWFSHDLVEVCYSEWVRSNEAAAQNAKSFRFEGDLSFFSFDVMFLYFFFVFI